MVIHCGCFVAFCLIKSTQREQNNRWAKNKSPDPETDLVYTFILSAHCRSLVAPPPPPPSRVATWLIGVFCSPAGRACEVLDSKMFAKAQKMLESGKVDDVRANQCICRSTTFAAHSALDGASVLDVVNPTHRLFQASHSFGQLT